MDIQLLLALTDPQMTRPSNKEGYWNHNGTQKEEPKHTSTSINSQLAMKLDLLHKLTSYLDASRSDYYITSSQYTALRSFMEHIDGHKQYDTLLGLLFGHSDFAKVVGSNGRSAIRIKSYS